VLPPSPRPHQATSQSTAAHIHTRCTLLLPLRRDDDYEEEDVVSQLMMKVEEQDNQMRMAAEIGQSLLQKNEHQAEEIIELEEERTRLVRRRRRRPHQYRTVAPWHRSWRCSCARAAVVLPLCPEQNVCVWCACAHTAVTACRRRWWRSSHTATRSSNRHSRASRR
jgi:hypothetical protein